MLNEYLQFWENKSCLEVAFKSRLLNVPPECRVCETDQTQKGHTS